MNKDITATLKVRHMQLIVALADHGTTHRAAEALNMTQSTASKMLREVEDIFESSLFDRKPRGLEPTPLGAFVIENVRGQLSRMRRFSDEFHARRAGGYGILSVGAITGAVPGLVAEAVAEIKRRRPQLVVQLHGETSDRVLELLRSGVIDLAVGRFSADRQRDMFTFELLAEERMVVVARAGHPLSGADVASLEDLAGCAWVMPPVSNPTRPVLDAAFESAGLSPPADMIECSSILLILNLVQVSDAVALLPAAVIDTYERAGVFARLPVRPEFRLSGFGLLTRRKEELTNPAAEFCDILRATAAA